MADIDAIAVAASTLSPLIIPAFDEPEAERARASAATASGPEAGFGGSKRGNLGTAARSASFILQKYHVRV